MATPQSAPATAGARAARPQTVLQVMKRVQIAPHLVRLTLGGPGFETFVDKPVTDRYIKIMFAKPELGLVPPYDMDQLREQLPMEDLPVRRTYTVRHCDMAAKTIDVDFVVHGDQGLAGPWARNAQVGEFVCFAGPGGLYFPKPEFDFHILTGDETAIPAISAALESMDDAMRGVAIIEVADAQDEMDLKAPAGVEVSWVHRGGSFDPQNTVLEKAVREFPWPEGRVQLFAHGEREVMKRLRGYFYNERGVDRRDMSLSAYWAFGRAEDDFQAEKQSPIGRIFEEEPQQRS
ncbi:siderophore-interacting protein [Glutamicibacter sp.]|uniref:siderophore-interacting protein n=1 Tax=Glutamicibacter sp. TaxID=1931995 RepID=UPI0028BF4FFC|nr:siderophore-interacting protein [Glutamicibacter sp.]